MTRIDYRKSGVNLQEGERAIQLIKDDVRSTFTGSVLSDIGHFGGLFKADFTQMDEPVLVASTDGVGTKLKLAGMMARYDSVGCDLVNHCVNDILVQGARPLFFMDYIACGSLDSRVLADIVSGLSSACRENGCALLGGETAEMPGFYGDGDYDVAGTIIGIVEKKRIIDGSGILPGMKIIGLPSSGLHTNGYSLARKVLFELAGLSPGDSNPLDPGQTVGESLMQVHRSYLKPLQPLLDKSIVTGIAHITGGGIPGNLSRILPDGCGAVIESCWDTPEVFRLIQELGSIEEAEMRSVFNMGAGLLIVVSDTEFHAAMKLLQTSGEKPFPAGEIVEGASIVYSRD